MIAVFLWIALLCFILGAVIELPKYLHGRKGEN